MPRAAVDRIELQIPPGALGGTWTGGTTLAQIDTTITRKDSRNKGGKASLHITNLSSWLEVGVGNVREAYLRCGVRFETGTGVGTIEFYAEHPAPIGDAYAHNMWAIGGVFFESSSRTLTAYYCPTPYFQQRANLATSVGTLAFDKWYLLEMRVSTLGIEVKIDGLPFVSGAASVMPQGAIDFGVDVFGVPHVHALPHKVQTLRFAYIGDGSGGQPMWIDDIGVNVPYMSYDNGAGAVPADDNSGHLSVVGAGGGSCFIDLPANTNPATTHIWGWNGIPFADNENLTLSNAHGSFTAKVNAPDATYVSGFLPNSLWLGDGYVVLCTPSGAGYHTGLTPSAGANYANVNAVPPTLTTWNEANATGSYDSYVGTDLPSSAGAVTAAEVIGTVHGDLAGLQHYEMMLKYDGGADSFGTATSTPTDTTTVGRILDVAPDGSGPMTPAKINNSEFGIRFST